MSTFSKGGGDFPGATVAKAGSVAGPTHGWCTTVSTVSATTDFSIWAGQYVKAYCEGTDVYFVFTTTSAPAMVTTSLSTLTEVRTRVADRLYAGVKEHFIIPHRTTKLKYKAISSSGTRRLVIIKS